MRKKVEYYDGHKITKNVLKKVNLIDLKRIQEGITEFTVEEFTSLKEMCEVYETLPQNHHIILGEDWYLLYTKNDEGELEIKDWVAIHNVENKFIQTMEMFTAIKKIFLENQECDMYGVLRHSTSYKFYKKLLESNYIDEGYDIIEFEDEIEEVEETKNKILSEYDSLEDYLLDPNRNTYQEISLDDHIYHFVCFNITDTFKNKYKKSGR